jgi:ATPase subunit of ABC transporter with duplicated ATPase domains
MPPKKNINKKNNQNNLKPSSSSNTNNSSTLNNYSNNSSDNQSSNSESDELDKPKKTPVKSTNRFNLIADSDNDSDNDSDSSDESDDSDSSDDSDNSDNSDNSDDSDSLDNSVNKPQVIIDNVVNPNQEENEENMNLFLRIPDNIFDRLGKPIPTDDESEPEENNQKLQTKTKKQNKQQRDQIKKSKQENKQKINKDVIKSENVGTIFADKVEILVNGKVLIGESNIVINEHTKYVVIGQNGVGKTTLLKYLSNKLKDTDILMIEQDIELEDSENKIRDFVLGARPELYLQYKRFRVLEEIENLTDKENEEYQEISQNLADNDWDRFEAESKKILNGLGFTNPELPVSILSGGWRMRLALGKALLRCPKLLILDEPTNHLDLDAVIWLTDYLTNYKNSLIVITHQIHLMNAIGQVTWYIGDPELTGTKIYSVNGSYFRVQKMIEMMGKEAEKNYDKFQRRVEELRRKSTPKKEVDEFIKKEGVPRPRKPYEVNIDFEEVNELGSNNIIDFREVSYSYGDKQIFDSIDYAMSLGSKNILVGPNGIGKTTLFKLASELIEPTSGYVLRDSRLRVGYYHQQIIDNLPLNLTPIQYLQSINSTLDINKCRAILGRLGIKKNDTIDLPSTKISILSGGQKARVSLASVQMQNPHLILMDEPTNHLDSESIEGLIKGINEFNGGVIVITHDMYLIESIENSTIYEIKNKKIIKFNGTFEEYCNKVIKI